MAISDLTNTTWILNYYITSTSEVFGSISHTGAGTFPAPGINVTGSYKTFDEDIYQEVTGNFDNITFEIDVNSQGHTWGPILITRLNDTLTGNLLYGGDYYGQNVANPFTYNRQEYRDVDLREITLTITGGQDATNQNFINWLNQNATQVITSKKSIKFNNKYLSKVNDSYLDKINGAPVQCFEKNVSLITFEIGNVIVNLPNPEPIFEPEFTYQAESGMTWAEWVESVYNTDGWINTGSDIEYYPPSGASILIINNASPNDVIVNNNQYVLNFGAGGGGN